MLVTNANVRCALLLFSCVGLTSCDVLNSALDCGGFGWPEFNTQSLPNPILNQVYRNTIKVSMTGYDSSFFYHYSFSIDNPLPEGLQYFSDDELLTIDGTATELGTFPFSVTVTVKDQILCEATRIKQFELEVVAE